MQFNFMNHIFSILRSRYIPYFCFSFWRKWCKGCQRVQIFAYIYMCVYIYIYICNNHATDSEERGKIFILNYFIEDTFFYYIIVDIKYTQYRIQILL